MPSGSHGGGGGGSHFGGGSSGGSHFGGGSYGSNRPSSPIRFYFFWTPLLCFFCKFK